MGGGDDVPVDLDPVLGGTQNTVTTAGGGYYLFERIASGKYFVRIPTSDFAGGAALEGLVSTPGNGADGTTDHPDDENGVDDAAPATNGIVSSVIEVQATLAPIMDLEVGPVSGQADESENLTLDFGFKSPTPTAATLAFFTATAGARGVNLGWQTLVEVNTLGFHVERGSAARAWQRITTSLISAEGLELLPRIYQFTDAGSPDATGTEYRLIEVERDGQERVLAVATVASGVKVTLSNRGGQLEIQLVGHAGSEGTVQSAPTVEGPWTTLDQVTFDANGGATLRLESDGAPGARFFRVMEE